LQKNIHDRLAFRNHAGQTATGFDIFADICFDGGIVKTFLQIAKEPKIEKWPALAAHFALQSMWLLMKKGDADEREDLLKELLDHDIVDFCLDVGQLQKISTIQLQITESDYQKEPIGDSSTRRRWDSQMFSGRKYAGSILISRANLQNYNPHVRVYSGGTSILRRAARERFTHLAEFFVLWKVRGMYTDQVKLYRILRAPF
jgi:hypothetical protein